MTRHTPPRRTAPSRLRSIAVLTAAAFVGASLIAPTSAPRAEAAPAHRHTESFTSPTGTTWVAPAGLTSIRISVAGARGGANMWGGGGGSGDIVTFELPVTPGDRFTFYGATDGDGRDGGKGWVSGGKGGDKSGSGKVGAGGGGAGAVMRNGQLIAVAGGGGGGGGGSWVRGDTVGGDNMIGGNGGDAGLSGSSGQAHKGTHPGAGGAGAARDFGKGGGNASSAASFSEGAGGGGGGGGYASGNGGSSGKKFNGHGAGGGGGGGSSWTAPGITPTIEKNENFEGYAIVSWEAPVELTAQVLSPTIQAGAPVYLRVSAVEAGTTTNVYGEFRILDGTTRIKSWYGYSQVVELNLTPGTHTIEVTHWEIMGSTTRQTLEIIVPEPLLQGGLGEPEQVAIDLDTVPRNVPHDTALTISGRLIGALGGTPAGVSVRAGWGDTAGHTTTDGAGQFTISLPAPGTVGSHELHLTTEANALFAAAPLLTLPVTAIDEISTVTLTPSATTLVYGQPLDATVSVTATGTGTPSGLVVLADQEDLIAMAALDADGEATFTDVFVHPGTTELRALYAGDEVHADAVSDPVALTVTDAATTTTLTASSHTGHAGDLTAIRVTVQAEAGSVLEPAGHVELLVDGEVFDTASIGSDADTTARDGRVVYDFDTTELPAGDLTLQARFVPGAGYQASQSDTVPLTLDAHQVRLFVSPSSIEITDGDTAIIAGHVEVLGHENGGLTRQTSGAPEVAGSLVAFLGDDVVGAAHVDPATGSAELELAGLPVGSGSLRIAFMPDTVALDSAQTELAYTVLAAATPAPTPAATPAAALATTGASGSESLIAIAAALIALLGAALIATRRRRAALTAEVTSR
ncbi:Ig-like domain-containing protein [Salinibacterium sp. ZJ70]|uniref:Ig-like domain-containing protein n=1 Tax=Salinibacterium sp. ZJ70 TaxID=2708084 RepID=UPI00142305A5|nr:Ig-like domain-containing protein [Salinibacterium sp. ZJ70]